MKKRRVISDYVNSFLLAETVNRCPLCGRFEGTVDTFTNHHINHDSSVSEYWNLIRICRTCHGDLTKNRQDGKRERKVRQIKKDLFRRLVGDGSYQVLIMANKYGITGTLPSLGMSLLQLELVTIKYSNPLSVGSAKHPTITDFEITPKGREFIDQLKIETDLPDLPLH